MYLSLLQWVGNDEKEPSGRDIPESVFRVTHKNVEYAAGAAGTRVGGGDDSGQRTLESWRMGEVEADVLQEDAQVCSALLSAFSHSHTLQYDHFLFFVDNALSDHLLMF